MTADKPDWAEQKARGIASSNGFQTLPYACRMLLHDQILAAADATVADEAREMVEELREAEAVMERLALKINNSPDGPLLPRAAALISRLAGLEGQE